MPRHSRFLLATSGAGLALALGMALVIATSRSAPAFTRVVAAMQDIRTATWEQTSTAYLAGEPRGRVRTSRVWVRTAPATCVERRDDGSRTLMDASGTRNFTPPNHYSRWSLPPGTDLGRQNVLMQVLSPGSPGSDQAGHWDTERILLEGKPALCYTREIRWGGGELPAGFPAEERYVRRNVDRIWVDPATLHIVRREHRQYDTRDNRLQHRLVARRFRFNAAPAPDTFTWKLPPGQAEVEVSSRPLSVEETAVCRKFIESAEAAWSAGDFERFARLWDFGYLDRFPNVRQAGSEIGATAPARRTQWERQLTARAGQPNPWVRWKSESFTATGVFSLAPLGSLPPGEPEVVRVETRGSVVQADESNWPFRSTYTLVRRDGGYRIVHWRHDLPDRVLWGK